jgi:hypothetical protein
LTARKTTASKEGDAPKKKKLEMEAKLEHKK